MKKIIISICIMVLAGVSVFAASNGSVAPTEKELAKLSKSYKLKETHKDLACGDCHGEVSLDKYYLINSDTCLNCHGSREDVAELTKHLDDKDVNPHRSFHSGVATECYECHREHKPSRNYCGNCHDTDIWMDPVP